MHLASRSPRRDRPATEVTEYLQRTPSSPIWRRFNGVAGRRSSSGSRDREIRDLGRRQTQLRAREAWPRADVDRGAATASTSTSRADRVESKRDRVHAEDGCGVRAPWPRPSRPWSSADVDGATIRLSDVARDGGRRGGPCACMAQLQRDRDGAGIGILQAVRAPTPCSIALDDVHDRIDELRASSCPRASTMPERDPSGFIDFSLSILRVRQTRPIFALIMGSLLAISHGASCSCAACDRPWW